MKFGELLKIHKPDLIISRRYDAWMQRSDGHPSYSDQALEFGARELLAQRTPRDRRGSVSASSLGKCHRRQVFTYIGVPTARVSPKTAAIFTNGTFMHLRWQMTGLTEGFLAEAEVKVPANEYRLTGTIDAISYEDSIVEFKSANSHSFSRAMTYGPLRGHDYQVGTYVLASGREKGILIYENKDTQEYTEIVLRREDLPLEQIEIAAKRLWDTIDAQELPPPLDELWELKQPCSTCPFADACVAIKSWSQADELAHQARCA